MTDKNKKLLIVEDDKFLTKIYKLKLEKEGYKMILASDSTKAVEIAKKEEPDMILLDIVMPKKNGFEVLEELKQDASVKDIPVIVISNLGQQEDVQKGMAQGAVDYIVKADTAIEEVVTKIEKYI